jgi:hypothetical protein
MDIEHERDDCGQYLFSTNEGTNKSTWGWEGGTARPMLRPRRQQLSTKTTLVLFPLSSKMTVQWLLASDQPTQHK